MRSKYVKQPTKPKKLLAFLIYLLVFTVTFVFSLGIIQFDYFEQLIKSNLNEDTFDEDAFELFIRYMEHMDYEGVGERLNREQIMIINTGIYKEFEQGILGDFVVDFVNENGEPTRCIFYFDRPLDQQCDW